MRLYLIRHPEPLIEAGICYGALDVPAKPAALTAAVAALLTLLPLLPQVAPQLANCNSITIYTSPLQRCAALANALQAAMPSSPIVVSPELMELNFGTWEGRSWDDIYAHDGASLEAWAALPVDYAPGAGESLRQLHHRVVTWLGELQQSGCETAIVVTHGGPLRVLLSLNVSLSANESNSLKNSLQTAYAVKAPPWGSLNVVSIGEVLGEQRVKNTA